MNILIRAELTAPPSSFSCFRDVTMYAYFFTRHVILVEIEHDLKDLYWHWLKDRGGMDFVAEIVCPGEEYVYRIDVKKGAKKTLFVTDRIVVDNVHDIINALHFV